MYQPTAFEETRRPVLHELVAAHPLATLVLRAVDGMSADHLPMLWRDDGSPDGVLAAHVARANPLWRCDGAEALAVFAGPQHYVSPSWYPGKQVDGRVVPTWNYAVVHLHGRLRVRDEPDWLRALLRELTDRHERPRAQPWSIDEAPEAHVDRLLGAIVGIEIPVERVEGKFKLSQNRPAADRAGVIAGLRAEGSAAAADLADRVARAAPAGSPPR